MAFGFIVGFWAMVGPLLFSRSWSSSSKAQCIPSEQDALLKLKHHLSDPTNNLASCHILELHLRTPPPLEFKYEKLHETLWFSGELHSSVLDLKHLNYLDLSGIDFGFIQIPAFLSSMANLTYLNLFSAGFGRSIPLHFWNLSNLIYLDLGGNYFEGSIPHQIGSLSNLIYLGSNYFEGSISRQIGSLSNLHYLDLGDNSYLNGSIPHEIGNLSNLLHLGLGGNGFSGSISQEIENLSNLNYLQLEDSYPFSMDEYVMSRSVENLHWLSALSSL
ncbi:receptor-like protein 43 [Prosopis cineraria]|uniref:receptor-like protein 43 n=1 Tax=Prosopis cineraria TaxID=364024 RepID=UPI0024105916|nr:receptor-like protein 43 [Prosopis cineraria]